MRTLDGERIVTRVNKGLLEIRNRRWGNNDH